MTIPPNQFKKATSTMIMYTPSTTRDDARSQSRSSTGASLTSVTVAEFQHTAAETVEHLFRSKNLDEAHEFFMNTPLKYSQFKFLVQTFAMKAMESRSVENATFVADVFGRLSGEEVPQSVLATYLFHHWCRG